jgi:hypothetical protein
LEFGGLTFQFEMDGENVEKVAVVVFGGGFDDCVNAQALISSPSSLWYTIRAPDW